MVYVIANVTFELTQFRFGNLGASLAVHALSTLPQFSVPEMLPLSDSMITYTEYLNDTNKRSAQDITLMKTTVQIFQSAAMKDNFWS